LERLAEIHSLWIGPRFGWVQQLSLRSWLAHGHRVTVWCYEAIEGVPNGVQLADAAAILPQQAIRRWRQVGSVAVFSDRFRYHLLRRLPATWLDTDMVLLRPLTDPSPYLFGWERSNSICTAVMRLPPDSPVLRDLIRLTDARVPVPGWWAPKERWGQRLRGLIGRHQRIEDMEWGSVGPMALTHAVLRRGLADRVQPAEVFYPVYCSDVSLFFAAPEAMSARLTDKTAAVHLWSSQLYERREPPPPPDSWLAAMCGRYGVEIGSAATVDEAGH
jgi:hypothetical protein